MFRIRFNPYFRNFIPESIKQTSTEYRTIPQTDQIINDTLTAFSALTGQGDSYDWHGGKSRNWKIYDNEFITYDKSDYTDIVYRNDSGYPVNNGDSIVVNGIGMESYDATVS